MKESSTAWKGTRWEDMTPAQREAKRASDHQLFHAHRPDPADELAAALDAHAVDHVGRLLELRRW